MLISMEQTHASLGILRLLWNPEMLQNWEIKPDGEVVYKAKELELAAGTFDLEQVLEKRVRRQPVVGLRMDEFEGPDPLGIAYLDSLLSLCQDRQITVHAYITAYHPRLVELLDTFPSRPVLDQVTRQVDETMGKYGIELHDYSLIDSFGGSAELFYDEIHMQPGNQVPLIYHLLGREEAGP